MQDIDKVAPIQKTADLLVERMSLRVNRLTLKLHVLKFYSAVLSVDYLGMNYENYIDFCMAF